MKRLVYILLLVSLFLNGIYTLRSWRSQIVASVPDGDSLQLTDGRRVRLLGVDAPERGRCMSDEARLMLDAVARGKHVRLKNVVQDDYGRVLANVIIEDFRTWAAYLHYRYFSDGKNTADPYLNRVMVRNGLARFESVEGEYKKTLTEASQEAKEHHRGIYSGVCRKPAPPDGCAIKGNIREGKPVYYMPNCKYYDQVIVDEAFGDRWFCSEKEAKDAGFAFAPSCD